MNQTNISNKYIKQIKTKVKEKKKNSFVNKIEIQPAVQSSGKIEQIKVENPAYKLSTPSS
jgi:hypothetical protein